MHSIDKYSTTTACRDALSAGPPGLKFVAYGNSTSVTTGYGVAAAVPLVPCTTANNATVRLPLKTDLACETVLRAAFSNNRVAL